MISISDKVVCVNDARQDDDLARIKKGVIYVVREIVPYNDGNGVGLRLVGVQPSQMHYRGKLHERTWNITRFRKLADIKAENAAKGVTARSHGA